jgi:hypothetical protein
MNVDILFDIFKYIDDGVTYKSIIFTCKEWKYVMETQLPNKKDEVIKHSNKPWDWCRIFYNPNITMEFIDKYPDNSWDLGIHLGIRILRWILS